MPLQKYVRQVKPLSEHPRYSHVDKVEMLLESKKSDKYEKVILKKLSDFITQRDLDFISLINMNIEGSEYRVLKDLIESGFIKNINHLQIQFHRNSFFYFINRYFLIKKLIKTHNLKWRYKYVWERWDLKQ